jgi:thiaminase/transcriptional activator TenA
MTPAARSGFTGELWAAGSRSTRTSSSILSSRPRQTGTRRSAFRFYVVEDAYYLTSSHGRSPILRRRRPATSGSSPSTATPSGRSRRSALHESYFRDFGLSEQEIRARPPAPTNLAYTSYLLATALEPFAEALSAVLPATGFTPRWEGARRKALQPLYQRWIDNYGSEAYEATVEAVLGIMDEAAKKSPSSAGT